MPEAEVTVDYTEKITQIADDLAFLRKHIEAKKDTEPVYQKQLEDQRVLTQEIYDELTRQALPSGTEVSVDDMKVIATQVQDMNEHFQNLENVGIPILVGVGLICGLLCALIFSSYLRH